MDDETERHLAKAATLHETIADALGLMIARCPTCGRIVELSTADVTMCLRSGWPECCGRTMTMGDGESLEDDALFNAHRPGQAPS